MVTWQAVRWPLLLFAAACNQVFDIEPTTALPPVMIPDEDGDGVDDEHDNCPTIANDQADLDEDGVGDACDNCVLVANTAQANDGDSDALGDVCDPHPANDGDCLVLFDSFRDPSRFDAHWMVTTSSGSASASPQAGRVTLTATGAATVAMFAHDAAGLPLAGTFDVHLLASIPDPGRAGSLAVMTNASMTTGDRCRLRTTANALPSVNAETSVVTTAPRPLTSAPHGTAAQFRLTSTRPDFSSHIVCVLDYGVALGTAFALSTAPAPASGVGVSVTGQDVGAIAIAIYRYQSPGTCAEPVIR